MRVRARIDENQPAIVQALLQLGCSVQSLATIGCGCPDLLVGMAGVNILLEVKNPEQDPNKRVLKPDEKKFHGIWKGQVAVVESADEATAVVRRCLAKESAA